MAHLPHLETDTFIAFIADNADHGIHRPGYNGVASLLPKATGNNLFVPTYAGLNYETIGLTGMPSYHESTGHKFEPRREPMHVESADGERVVLVQPETSHARVSARITFRVEPPHYLHQTIELTPHKRFCPGSQEHRLSSLWASYLHAPRDRHIYLRPSLETGHARAGWCAVTKADHSAPGTDVIPLPDTELGHAGHLAAAEAGTATPLGERTDLDEDLKTGLQFYYGLPDAGLLFLMMFRQQTMFRLAYSPCGGGKEPAWSPAWDYVLNVPDAQVGTTYTWDCCLAVKPFAGREDILREVADYRST